MAIQNAYLRRAILLGHEDQEIETTVGVSPFVAEIGEEGRERERKESGRRIK